MKRALLLLLAAALPAAAQDTTPPVITFEQPAAGACVGADQTVRLTVADAGSGVASGVTVSANGNDVTSAFSPCSDVTAAWTLRKAVKLGTQGTSAHAFFLPQLPGGPQYLFEDDGAFVEYANGTAHLTGTIVSRTHATKRWRVDLWYTTSTASAKLELQKKYYVAKGGPIDPATWRYYELDETRARLTGLGDFAGKTLNLYARPANKVYKFQVGVGANGKNLTMGGSGWLGYTGDYNGNKGDINVYFLPAVCLQSTVSQLGAEGPITLSVSASDLSGNVGNGSHAFEADVSGPTLTVAPANGAVVEAGPTELRVDFADAGCGVQASSFSATLDGQDVTAQFTLNNGTATATIDLAGGSHTLNVSLADTVENRSSASSTFEVGLSAVALQLSLAPGDPSNLLIKTENDLTIRAVAASGVTVPDFVGTVQISVSGGQAPLLDGMLVPFTAADAGVVTVPQLAFFESIGDFTITAVNLASAPDDITGTLNVRATVGAPVVNALPKKTVDPQLTVSGWSFANTQVDIYVRGVLVVSTTAGSDGAFTAGVTLAEGPSAIYVEAVDPFDGQTKPSQTQTVDLICQTISFADPKLEEAVRTAIRKPTGTITPADVSGLTYLQAVNKGITDVSGIECLTDLVSLDLGRNQISDVAPIGCLIKLQSLHLHQNRISDISAFSSLAELRTLFLYSNQISDVSPLGGLKKLYYLYANNNQITGLPDLSGSTAIQYIYADNNRISDLSPLAGLTTLRGLRVGRNQISDLSPLAGLTDLSDLYLYQNSISDITPLASLTELRTLWLYSNQISDVSPLDGLMKLYYLYASNNQITRFPDLSGSTAIQYIYIDNNQISDLSPVAGLTTLRGLRVGQNQITDVSPLAGLTNLSDLYLYLNSISDITPLASLTELRTLFLYSNQISDVSPLDGLMKLYYLYASNNQITRFPDLSGSTAIQYIYMDNNRISDLSPLAGLTTLRGLRVGQNQITDVSPLAGLTNLSDLYLYRNSISDITPLAGLTELRTLFLYSNQISDVSPLDGLMKLYYLYASNNQITRFPDLSGSTAIQYIYIDNNQISDLSPLAGLTTLRGLRVGQNQISDLSPLAGLTNLSDLYLYLNSISDITPLAGLTELRVLFLYNNQITDLSPLDGLKKLYYLYASNNLIPALPDFSGNTAIQYIYMDNNLLTDVSGLLPVTSLRQLRARWNSIPCPNATIDALRARGVSVTSDCQ